MFPKEARGAFTFRKWLTKLYSKPDAPELYNVRTLHITALPNVLCEVGPPGGLEPVADVTRVHSLLLQVHLFHVRLEVAFVGRREGAPVTGENPAANAKL